MGQILNANTIGIPYQRGIGIPYANSAIRYLKYKVGLWFFDVIGNFDGESISESIIDLNPFDLTNPDLALQIMDKSDITIWNQLDSNNNSIRDLPGYNPGNPFSWLKSELEQDFISTYINPSYWNYIFVNFSSSNQLLIYNRNLNCTEGTVVHNKLKTGNVWTLITGKWNDCSYWKDEKYWRD